MSHDRKYNWSKEFNEDICKSTKNCNLTFKNSIEINTQEINLPIKRSIQIYIQRKLSSLGMLKFSKEFGIQINFTDRSHNDNISIIGFCSGDHVLGIEIRCTEYMKQCLKKNLESQFYNYNIIWTIIK